MAAVPRHKHLVLILAREFASNLSTPTLITDDDGRLVFFNEAAEEIVETTFAEMGELPFDEWMGRFSARTPEADPLPPERRPTAIALRERHPVHERYRATSAEGVERDIAVTALPLFAHADEFVGVLTIFWRA
jgi:PAS domain-containing protein